MAPALKIYLLTFFIDTTLLALLTGYAFYQYRRRSNVIRQIGWLLFSSFTANVLSYMLTGPVRNVPGSVYDFALIAFLSWIYNDQTEGRYKNFFVTCTVLYVVLGVYNVFFVQPLTITSYNKLMASFLIIGYTVMFFYKLMKDLPERQVHQLPMFWFNSAFLLYYAGTLFLFAFTSYLINVLKNDLLYYALFHNVLVIIQHCIIFLGLRYDHRRLNKSESGALKRYPA